MDKEGILKKFVSLGKNSTSPADTTSKSTVDWQRFENIARKAIEDKLLEIGKIKEITREINLNADRKRFWIKILQSIDELQNSDSLPISLNHFSKKEI